MIWHADVCHQVKNIKNIENCERKYPMEEQIRAKLDELRGMLKADGGDLEVVGIEGTDVQLRLKGACAGCPHAMVTLKQGIERILKEQVDQSITVIQVN